MYELAGDRFLIFQPKKHVAVHNWCSSQSTVCSPSDYVVLDHHFNVCVMNHKQIEIIIKKSKLIKTENGGVDDTR